MSEVKIGKLTLPSNVFLAPMAGYTNYPFRKICIEMGAALTFTEMVSAKGLMYGSEETKKLLLFGEERPRAVQIFGSDPSIMRAACESEELAPFDIVDINMGCPMPKIVKNGEGSALMENFPLAEKIISECAKSGKIISVKFRTGIREGDQMAEEFARLAEGAGASMITIHGRVREKIYAGEVDFQQIANAKKAVKIPVVANGGIWCKKDADEMFSKTGADAVAIGRAALHHPQIFSSLQNKEEPPILPLFLKQLFLTREYYGERFACVFMRKMAAFYLKGRTGVAEMRRKLFAVQSTHELESLAREIL